MRGAILQSYAVVCACGLAAFVLTAKAIGCVRSALSVRNTEGVSHV